MWSELTNAADAESLKINSLRSPDNYQVIFKNSTRCGTSRMARSMFEMEWNSDVPVYLINVIEHRDASDRIAELFGVRHESPQVLIVRNGKCIYHNSHSDIDAAEILKMISEPLS